MVTRKFIARSLNTIKIWNVISVTNGYQVEYGNINFSKLSTVNRLYTLKEMESLIRKKLKQGYVEITNFENVNYDSILGMANTDLDNHPKPMKAQPFKLGKFDYSEYAFGQPKINGVRCFIIWGTVHEGEGMFAKTTEQAIILSKEGNRYVLPHIEKLFNKLMFQSVDAYDGELYIPGYTLNQIKASIPMINHKGTLSKPSGKPELVQFWMFDIADDNKSQVNRLALINYMSDGYFNNIAITQNSVNDHLNLKSNIVIVQSKVIYNDSEALAFANNAIAAGFEGAIIRNIDATYNFGQRPRTMMKIKLNSQGMAVQDAEFEVIDVIPKPNEPETGLFICKNDINDETFKCNPEGTFKQRAEYLINKHKYIGKLATVKFGERSGIKRVPFHANVITIRDYE